MSTWQKGQSGNPSGRSRETAEVRRARELAREKAPRAIERLVELMESENHRVALEAAQGILDRALGKPVQATDLHVSTPGSDLASLPPEQRVELLRAALAAEQAHLDAAVPVPVPTLPAPKS